jgi:signal transduction histidine kinase
MDDTKEGLLLIWTTTIILVAFLITLLAVMIIYRKRKLDHAKEIGLLNEKFARELLQAQMEMQQLTMQQIGREIHDDVGQKLVLAALYIRQFAFDDELANKKVNTVSAIIDESLADLRGLSKSLTDISYLDGDLCQLISIECDRVQAAGTCKAHFESDINYINVSQPIKKFVLRIIQEFLQNSLKHANCNEIHVCVRGEESELFVSASDDGIGFLMTDLGNNIGIGLKNMKKRAEMIGAKFSLESYPGKGTRLLLKVPSGKLK